MNSIYFYETEIGKLAIEEDGKTITKVYFSNEEIPLDRNVEETPLLKEAGKQLKAYFAGEIQQFNLPLSHEGTPFMQLVWNELKNIPYGETRCYQDIAEKINNPKAVRAVGLANNRNPLPIFIPCHRVIGKNGKLTGYAGGLEVKEYLLSLEKKHGDF
ncbi:methylated-DNA--[protein]-cysteine S-methyltransferase [Bacillus sp. AGMB 02131]|uniref:Methylated-DNA--protein-cysteine methyltransferase n=1 Tax=Peribacillus faecalis TaxID=2772559 RepID=A0A927D2U7_9BACI|nr:methylated-DNA--[protein]-cysteine S-methyltransferase [Peribacillus faecalis]MBD3110054.1 methylated-DNA--[protein]-cysteine S-methyltransferase [Peribacillus faecalis]